ncbi:MAG: 50S ribosomal protein L25 [Gemmatimonadetes bacterium]|nr:50S ribosomal protein L25 [Gemmatimonadota bacterium]
MAKAALLSANIRTGAGKGAARSLRRSGKIPAIVYGRGREAESLELDAVALERLLTKVRAGNTLLDVTVADRQPIKALIREIQRNPVRPSDILHVDLYEVHADEAIAVEVPLKFVGTAEGVRNSGGVFEAALHQIEIKVLPGDIPEYVEVDVTALGLGQSRHVSDLVAGKFEIMTDGAVTICLVVSPKAEEVAPVAAADEAPASEPELIRKAKATDEDEDAKKD